MYIVTISHGSAYIYPVQGSLAGWCDICQGSFLPGGLCISLSTHTHPHQAPFRPGYSHHA